MLTAEQAAAILQVRPSWLCRRTAARAVPCRFLGKHRRFAVRDVEQIAETCQSVPTGHDTHIGDLPERA
ncbi:helix-turn-helix domain-containing protein [Saccharothrix violaceirubra]|uniref:helix-turn-helix domain-containing protein n=1 Tax=Saccharothrix violaceirubra TaxID=413306 RepID=UPI003CD099DD